MNAWLEPLSKALLRYGIKTGALSIGLRAVDGLRRLVIVHHLMMVAGLLCALSFFAAGFEICATWTEFQWQAPPSALIYCIVVFAASGSALWYSCRGHTWVSAFGLQRQIQAALYEHRVAALAPAAVDSEALAALITKIVEQKLHGEHSAEHLSPERT